MVEYIYALSMVLMEMLFLFVVLLALYHQRKVIGDSAFLMVVALLFTFDRWVAAADIRAVLWGTTTFHVGEVAIGIPALTTFLLVYIMQGVLAAQRVLLGVIVSFLIYIYIGQITRLQCSWTGYSLFPGLYGGALEALLSSGRMTVNVLAVSHFFELLCLPMLYNRLTIWGMPRKWAIMLALPGTLLAGLLPGIASVVAGGSILQMFNGDFYARLIAIVILAALLVVYIERFETEVTDTRVGVLDFVFAFFGSYGKLQETEKNLLEWQNRFHAVFDHSTEIILTCDDRGRIMDANIAAKELFRTTKNASITGQPLKKLIDITGNNELDLKNTFHAPKHFECTVKLSNDKNALLQASIFPVQMHRQMLFVMTARDITTEREFAREKETLTEQLNHSQRLESLGILAGGIAHDFNNCIHAILGYVDAAAFFDRGNPEALEKHLAKIGKIAEQAGKLTQQMLGFARRGKYHVVNISLREIFEQCRMLMSPQKLAAIDFEVTLPPPDFIIAADSFQIQQVLINMLLNSVDALKGSINAKLELFAAAGADSPVKFVPPPDNEENRMPDDYLAIIIRDNGCGMPPEIASRIFEPFFTTKPVGSGTGMGLSMAHGIIANHKGSIQLSSTPGKGTTFAIFLPKGKTF